MKPKTKNQKSLLARTAPVLAIIDISSYFYRAYHALPSLTTSRGLPTNAILGVTNMLLKVLRERQPQYLALAFDSKGPTFRHQRYAAYKAQRPGMPEELVRQLPYIYQIIDALKLPTLARQGYEADDLIGTLVNKAKSQDLEVEIISGDKDLLPLVQEGVTMWDPMKEIRWTEAVVQEKFGLSPSELIEVRALAGDASDNIPGVPGIGEKTAIKLIRRYHTLENLLAHAEELPEKTLRARLREHAATARLSRELVTLNDQALPDLNLSELRPGRPDRQALQKIFLELEFSKLLKDLGVETVRSEAFHVVRDAGHLAEVAAAIRSAGQVALFFLVGDGHPVLAPVVGLALSWRPGEGTYLPLREGWTPEKLWAILGPVWQDATIAKVSADLKTALLLSERYGQKLAGAVGDVLLASYLLNPARYEQTLDNVALHHLGINLPGVRDLAGGPGPASDLPVELACQYACERATAALQAWPLLKAELGKEELWALYRDLELPLTAVLARMEAQGIALDQCFLQSFGGELKRALQNLSQEIFALAGESFLIQSPQQLGRILFEKLKLPPQKKTKGKTHYSTDGEVLQSLAEQAPIAGLVLEYRRLGKLKATYVDALLKLAHPVTGRVHTTFLQAVAATGRLSSRDPNLQNIPVRGELGSQIRQAFVAAPGHLFLSADYSQMELRLLAHFSQDQTLLKAFQQGVDIHRETAAAVFGIHPELVSAEMRRQAKVINFGIIYGMSAFGLAKQLGVGQRLAQDFINRYFARHPQVKAYLDKTLAEARQRGWVTTLLGRRRQIPQLHSPKRLVRQEAERSAINTPLQGSAADLIKKAMLSIDQGLSAAGFSARMLLQLHDELLLEIPAAELTDTARLVKQTMEAVASLRVPLTAELRVGDNWGNLSRLAIDK